MVNHLLETSHPFSSSALRASVSLRPAPFPFSLLTHGSENSHFIQTLSFHTLAHSLARRKTQLVSFQAIAHSLSQNTGGGGRRCSGYGPGGWLADWAGRN